MIWLLIGGGLLVIGFLSYRYNVPDGTDLDPCRDMAYAELIYGDDVTVSPDRRAAALRSYKRWISEAGKSKPEAE